MKIKIIIIVSFFSLATNAQSGSLKIFNQFHQYFKEEKYDSIALLLPNNFMLINEFGDTVSNKEKYINQFKTIEKAFKTKWVVKSVNVFKNKVESVEYDINALNDFLYYQPLQYKFIYTIKNNKLSQLKYDSIPHTNYNQIKEKSNSRFYTLMNWIKQNHPEDISLLSSQTYESYLLLKKYLSEYLKYSNG